MTKENIKKKIARFFLKRKKQIMVAIIILSLVSIIYGTYVYVLFTWVVVVPTPSVFLIKPDHNEEINVSTTQFNWTGVGGKDMLRYVWYADTDPTFTSPNLRAVFTNTSTNITPVPFLDGVWYWRVEVTDGESVNVSSTRILIINTTVYDFPYLDNVSLVPSSGTTITTFNYYVTYYHPNNLSATVMNITINGVQYEMTEVDPSDTNTTDGKEYFYSTTLPVGLHNYSFVCSDGIATASTELFIGPSVVDQFPPEVTDPYPPNQSINIGLNTETRITIHDPNGGPMNIIWLDNTSGTWQPFATDLGVLDGTYTQTSPNFVNYSTTYWWRVSVTDGVDTVNRTYHFTTISSLTISLLGPESNSTGHCPNCIHLSVYINSHRGLPMELTFHSNLSGTWDYFYRGEDNLTFSNCLNGSYVIRVPYFVRYNHQYFWNATVTDGIDVLSIPITSFSTAVSPDECQVKGGASYTWVVGIIIVLSVFPIIIYRVRRKKR